MKFFIIVLISLLTACSSRQNTSQLSVMITNLAENSGGSGTILESSADGSVVLTNAHVCEVLKHGGYVHNSEGEKFMATSYKVSEIHDLCAVLVAKNLKVSAKLFTIPLSKFESISVVGHPLLYPTLITEGYASARMRANILMGWRECTPEEASNPDYSEVCTFVGKVPMIVIRDSLLVSALIQPGSSGSPVFNSRGEIAAVIFAGEGDIGFGLAVPGEYINRFLFVEMERLPLQVPNYNYDPLKELQVKRNTTNFEEKMHEFCSNKDHRDNKLCVMYDSARILR